VDLMEPTIGRCGVRRRAMVEVEFRGLGGFGNTAEQQEHVRDRRRQRTALRHDVCEGIAGGEEFLPLHFQWSMKSSWPREWLPAGNQIRPRAKPALAGLFR